MASRSKRGTQDSVVPSESHKNTISLNIVLAPSGVCLNKALEKVKQVLTNDYAITVFHQDIEEAILEIYREECDSSASKMRDVIENHARNQIRELWKRGFSAAINRVLEDMASDRTGISEPISILSGHSIYYHPTLPQFYIPIDYHKIFDELVKNSHNGLIVSNVILLVDDVFEMYIELSKAESILSRDTAFFDAIRKKREESGIYGEIDLKAWTETKDGYPGQNDSERIVCLEKDLQQLSEILHWRIQEMTIAEQLAVHLGARFTLFSTKQHIDTLLKVIQGKPRVYISHPITQPRRNSTRKSRSLKEDPIIEELALLVSGLGEYACISPTGIDEFRFASVTRRYGHSFRKRSLRDGSLSDRWPLMGELDDLVFPSEAEEWIDYGKHLLKLQCNSLENQIHVDSAINQIENLIELQVGIRDHLIVANSDAILIFRQYYQGAKSQGVSRELDHWKYIVLDDPSKNALYIFYHDDIIDMAEYIQRQSGRAGLTEATRQAIIDYIKGHTSAGIADKLESIDKQFIGERFQQGTLGTAIDRGDKHKIRELLKGLSTVEIARNVLSNLCIPLIVPPTARIALVKNDNELDEKVNRIEQLFSAATFPTTAELLDSFWERVERSRIESLLKKKLRSLGDVTFEEFLGDEISWWREQI